MTEAQQIGAPVPTRIGWMSHHIEGVEPLDALIAAGYPIACILTLEDDLLAQRSGAASYAQTAARHEIPLYKVCNVNDAAALALLDSLQLDVLFVIGWSQILRKPALEKVRIGCFGTHASLLPANRGSAPINWALIKGETRTGNTLMRLSPQVDAGDIVAQRAFAITPFDTAETLYAKVARSNTEMLLELVAQMLTGKRVVTTPQQQDGTPLLPRRRPGDGLIDWSLPADRIYDWVRALARPYPGAFTHDTVGQTLTIWRVALLPPGPPLAVAGTTIGPMFSPDPAACGLVVACGTGAVVLLEVELPSGDCLSGPALAEATFGAFSNHGNPTHA